MAYLDFACHHLTAKHILARAPQSVLELGCTMGHVLKRIQDAGVPGEGMDISHYAHAMRVCNPIHRHDICQTPWPVDRAFDLCFSVAVLEHVPEKHLASVIRESARVSKRGLHGIGTNDPGNAISTRVTIRPLDWWREQFSRHAPGYPVELVEKDVLEQGQMPKEIAEGIPGQVKLNLGCGTSMFHHGWINYDVQDLGQFAANGGYRFERMDLRSGLPHATGVVDLIAGFHVLQFLSYDDGLRLLKECRRVLKPRTGAMRLCVVDAGSLAEDWMDETLHQYDVISEGSANAPTSAMKFYDLLLAGAQSIYDCGTLHHFLKESGIASYVAPFRAPAPNITHPGPKQILRETTECYYGGLSLFVDAIPLVG